MVYKTVYQALLSSRSLTQSAVAEKTSINRGQFNAWLKSGRNISDEKVALIIATVLELAKAAPDSESTQNALDVLRQDPIYQRFYVNNFPASPVVGGHRCYVMRQAETNLEHALQQQPLDVAILGGPQMGKTSLLNWLVHHPGRRHQVLRLDFRQTPPPDPLAALAQLASKRSAPGQSASLQDWAAFPDWARRHLLVTKKPTTLLLDHLESLPDAALQALQDGLHHFINQRRDEPILDQINLILAYDEAHPTMQASRNHASGLMRDLSTVALLPFNADQVAQLLQAILGLHPGPELDEAIQDALVHFAGHPLLTHHWAHLVSEQTGNMDFAQARADMAAAMQDRLFLPYLAHLDDKVKAALHAAPDNPPPDDLPATLNLTLYREQILWLSDSGLFVANDSLSPSSVQFATRWIQDQLLTALRTPS